MQQNSLPPSASAAAATRSAALSSNALSSNAFSSNAFSSNAWPFVEARKIYERLRQESARAGSRELPLRKVLFQTGYGPSGLPHIGTFGEVLRTSMVRRAFSLLSPEHTSELICFSDDMDGLRKVPESAPQPEMLRAHLGVPLSSVPDPYGCHSSYASHNNELLKGFLDRFGFSYSFKSSSECYRRGDFDAALRRVLERYDKIVELIRGTLGEERRETYSPFLPICAESGVVLQAKVLEVDAKRGVILYEDASSKKCETSVYGGKCKLQWKPDWAMRWYVLGIDYEMYGKDLIPSAELSRKIAVILGDGGAGDGGAGDGGAGDVGAGEPAGAGEKAAASDSEDKTPRMRYRAPVGFAYELFLDERGEKISKSRGNGLTIDDWLRYGSEDSLAYYMYRKPRTAKRLFFDCIPRCLDEYLVERRKFDEEGDQKGDEEVDHAAKLDSAVFHIEQPILTKLPQGLNFSLLQNLVTALGLQSEGVAGSGLSASDAWRSVLSDSLPAELSRAEQTSLHLLWGYALAYDRDFVRPFCSPRAASAEERVALRSLASRLGELPLDSGVETIQTVVYEVGMASGYDGRLRDWFRALYEILLGQSTGPRFGGFLRLYGLPSGITMIERALQK